MTQDLYTSSFPPRPQPQDLEARVRLRIVEEAGQGIFIDRGLPVPERYGQDYIRLMIQEPHSLFVYWELSDATLAERGFAAGNRMLLALVDLDNQTSSIADVGFTDNWWYRASPGRGYQCQLGLMKDEQFIEVLRSSTVRTPRGSLSERIDESPTWAVGGWRFLHLLRAAGMQFESLPAEWLRGIPLDLQQALASSAGLAFEEAVRLWSIRQTGPQGSPLSRQTGPSSPMFQGYSSPMTKSSRP